MTEPFVSKANSSDPDTEVTTFYWPMASATRHTLTVAKYLLNATLLRCRAAAGAERFLRLAWRVQGVDRAGREPGSGVGRAKGSL